MQATADTGAGAPTPAPSTPPPEPPGKVTIIVADELGPFEASLEINATGDAAFFQADDFGVLLTAKSARRMALALIAAANWLEAQPVLINEQSR